MVRDTPLRLTRQDMSESCAHSAPTHLPYNSQGRAALCGWQIAKQGRRSKMTWRPFAQKNGQCGTERHPPLSRIIAPEKRVAAQAGILVAEVGPAPAQPFDLNAGNADPRANAGDGYVFGSRKRHPG